jgi:formylglycine-generating enzyme required for sulfatase activity
MYRKTFCISAVIAVALLFAFLFAVACDTATEDEPIRQGSDDDDNDGGPPDLDDDADDDADDDDDDSTPPGEEILIPEGPFFMGEEPEFPYGYDNERPRHEVQMSAYYIDTTEVTNTDFLAFLAEHPDNLCSDEPCICDMHVQYTYAGIYLEGEEWKVDSGFENRPAMCVTWYGALAYCEWLGKTLPTEAQWEKAAKGADEHYVYPWGDEWKAHASNWMQSDDPWEDGSWPATTPTCTFDGTLYEGPYQTDDGRSPYGVCDLSGNAWEWTWDWNDGNYYKTEPEGGWVDPQGPADGWLKTLRGGCWRDEANYLYRQATSHRGRAYEPNHIDEFTGFRCARPAE